MKKCPTCDKTFEDSMRFCQIDGTPLVDDAPAFDPYATIVSSPKPAAPVAEPEEAPATETAAEAASIPVPEPVVAPIAEPDEVLDLPAEDPLKTMFVSESEMRDALGDAAPAAEEPVIEMPEIEDAVVPEAPVIEPMSSPEPPSFSVPDVPAPSFGEAAPPPSPFAASDSVADEPIHEPSVFDEPVPPPPPVFDEPVPAPPVFEEPAPAFDEAATMIQPPVSTPFEPPAPAFEPPPAPVFEPTPVASFDPPPPAPVAEWAPPPAPDASWQNQEIGSNTPFQPPPAGTGSLNQTLAIVSLVLGIISLCCYISPITGLAALITGYMAMKKANNDPANFGGKGLAIGGMVTGGIFFLLGVAYWIYIIIVVGFVGLSSFSR
ncbi:MAG TPA: DUF4190 domain-containing protein [Pyrinomonadaceae bacterium]|nr:DUF4190 domain-containing protein [Pyrinomonadaceae bacterium]